MGNGKTSTIVHQPHLKLCTSAGNIDYLSMAHLPYAFPAFVVFLVVCLPPPILLIWYPSGRRAVSKATSKCTGESNCHVNLPYSCLRFSLIDKMKPLLDSFQSCYKDNCRFFAGLQFMYRLIILGTFNFSISPLVFYILVDTEMVLMLLYTRSSGHIKSSGRTSWTVWFMSILHL